MHAACMFMATQTYTYFDVLTLWLFSNRKQWEELAAKWSHESIMSSDWHKTKGDLRVFAQHAGLFFNECALEYGTRIMIDSGSVKDVHAFIEAFEYNKIGVRLETDRLLMNKDLLRLY